jgi:hypothetical protein
MIFLVVITVSAILAALTLGLVWMGVSLPVALVALGQTAFILVVFFAGMAVGYFLSERNAIKDAATARRDAALITALGMAMKEGARHTGRTEPIMTIDGVGNLLPPISGFDEE